MNPPPRDFANFLQGALREHFEPLREHVSSIRERAELPRGHAKKQLEARVKAGALSRRIRSATLPEEMRQKVKRSGERPPDANLEVSRQNQNRHPEVQLVC